MTVQIFKVQERNSSISHYTLAIHQLSKWFEVPADTWEGLSRTAVLEWAGELGPRYQLRTWQHRYLVGEDAPRLYQNKLIERLSVGSLVACVGDRSIQELMDRAGVR